MKHWHVIDNDEICLTDKEYQFANFYLGDAKLNATQAARMAGYSPHTARQQGYENLTKPYIKKYIRGKSSEALSKIGITQEMVLAELAKVAFSDIGDFLNTDWTLKNLKEIDPRKTACIKSLKKKGSGQTIQLHDKLKALKILVELLGDLECDQCS